MSRYSEVYGFIWGFPGGRVVKKPPASEEIWVPSLGEEDPPRGRNGSPLQNSCLERSMDRGTWRATVHGVAELKLTEWLSTTTTIGMSISA